MDTFTNVVLMIFVFIACAALFILIRSEWVFKKRMELNRHENGVHVITEYIDYNQMVFKFWIWDIEKMRIKKIDTGE